MEEMSLGGYLNCREVRTQRGFDLKAFMQKQGKKADDFVDQGIVNAHFFLPQWLLGGGSKECLFGESACKFVAARESEVNKTSESC